MTNYTFHFYFMDNSGYRANFKIKANSKLAAIDKGFLKARKMAKGDITSWECKLILGV